MLEPYYCWELNPHVPKLNDTVYGNDAMTSRDLNFFLYTRVKLILDSIQCGIVSQRMYPIEIKYIDA